MITMLHTHNIEKVQLNIASKKLINYTHNQKSPGSCKEKILPADRNREIMTYYRLIILRNNYYE